MRAIRRLLAAILLLVFGADLVHARGIGDWSDVEAISAGTPVRIQLTNKASERGVLARTESDRILVNVRGVPQEFFRTRIAELAVGSMGTHFLLYAVIGAAAGGAIGGAIEAGNKSNEDKNVALVVLTLLGAGLGGLVGGKRREHFKVIYRAP